MIIISAAAAAAAGRSVTRTDVFRAFYYTVLRAAVVFFGGAGFPSPSRKRRDIVSPRLWESLTIVRLLLILVIARIQICATRLHTDTCLVYMHFGWATAEVKREEHTDFISF